MKAKNVKPARVTRADVAAKAGISPTTVAYVLNETPGVKIREATRAKVLKAAKELDYTPSFTARSMKRGRTELVGILMPSLSSQFHPFYAQMLHGVYEAAAESNYHFLLLTQERADKYQRCLSQSYLDGVIVVQSDNNSAHIKNVTDRGLPAVTLNTRHTLPSPQVTMDYEAAMTQAVEMLLDKGTRKLLFVHGNWENQPISRYCQTFEKLSGERRRPKVRFDSMGIERYQLDPEQITHLLQEGWDGLIIDGFELARDVAQHEHFRKQEEPIAMVVFSESAAPVNLGDQVTILQSQPHKSGQLAWEQLTEQLAGTPARNTLTKVPFSNLNLTTS